MYMTYVRQVQKREHAAGARSQVNTARSARQGIAGAQGVTKEGLGVVRSCAGGPSVLLRFRTYLGARATTSVEQERFWMA